MANVTFTFGPKTKTFVVSAGSLTRFSNWAAVAYATIPNPDTTPGQPATIPNPDPVGSAIDALWAGIRANVMSVELATGVAAVVKPVDLT